VTDPLPPDPDDQDRTATIERRCPDCGFDPTAVEHFDDWDQDATALEQEYWRPAHHARDVTRPRSV
jgi:hypothetical protein